MKKVLVVALGLLLTNLILTGVSITQKPKIAFVRSQDLVYSYLGMKEVQNNFETQKQLWQHTMDTIRTDYKEALKLYHVEARQLSLEEKKERQTYLQRLEQNMIQYAEVVQKTSKKEEERMLEGVLNQVNSFVQEYGKRKGYDVIFGTTLSGNILYGKEVIDITNELVAELNQTYK